MSAYEFYKLKPKEKQLVFQNLKNKTGFPEFVFEKDWWVTQTLFVISQMAVARHLLFKGGTSLSKAWSLINRFSEDIDLALNREYLGFDSGLISKSQVKKLRKESFKFINSTFYNDLQKAFKNQGYTDVTFELENTIDTDRDPVAILIYYPAVTQYSDYISPRIKIEIGSRSLVEPFTYRQIQSYVGIHYKDLPIADEAFSMACVNPERTLLEKLFLLHEEFQKPQDKMRVNRLSRHLYDIVKIFQSEHYQKALNPALIKDIIRHREHFNAMKNVDYQSLFPPGLNPIPPDEVLHQWEKDYKIMQTYMITEKSPDFYNLIQMIKQVVTQYNNLKF